MTTTRRHPTPRPDPTATWLALGALLLAVALLVALFGWTSTRALDGIAADVAATALRVERLDEALRGVLAAPTFGSSTRRARRGGSST